MLERSRLIFKWLNNWIENQTKVKKLEDIDLDKVDFDKYKITVYAGSKFYRIVHQGTDPLAPTGRWSRFVSQPMGFDPSKVRIGTQAHTGATCYSNTPITACLEVGDLTGREMYQITLKSDIEAVDLDSICMAEGISKPYMPKDHTPFFHKLYGKHIKAFRFESAQNSNDYNVVIYNDWFKEFPNLVDKELMDKDAIIKYLIDFVREVLFRCGNWLTSIRTDYYFPHAGR